MTALSRFWRWFTDDLSSATDAEYGVVQEHFVSHGEIGRHRIDYRQLGRVLADPKRAPTIPAAPSVPRTLTLLRTTGELSEELHGAFPIDSVAVPVPVLVELSRLAEIGFADEYERALFSNDPRLEDAVTRGALARKALRALLSETPPLAEAVR